MNASAGPGARFTPQPDLPADVPDRMGRLGADDEAGHEADPRIPARMAALMAENHELRAEVERLRAERAQVANIQSRLMEVIGCKSPDRLVHDVRNILNERELYRALADVTAD